MQRRSPVFMSRSSQENGEFAGSFWLCAQCAKALEPLSALRVTPELTGTVGALYEETVARLESSLQTVCADFQPDPYAKVRSWTWSHEGARFRRHLSCCPTSYFVAYAWRED